MDTRLVRILTDRYLRDLMHSAKLATPAAEGLETKLKFRAMYLAVITISTLEAHPDLVTIHTDQDVP